MTVLSKRGLLQAFIGVGAVALAGTAGAAVPAPLAGVDAAGAAEIGQAWLSARSGVTARALSADLFPRGLSDSALRGISDRVRADFARGVVFAHKGWFLSETEARICALIALS